MINPIRATVINIPAPKTNDIKNVLPRDILPCELINPIISGILDKWQGLRRILIIPQPKDAKIAINVLPVSAVLRKLKMLSIIIIAGYLLPVIEKIYLFLLPGRIPGAA